MKNALMWSVLAGSAISMPVLADNDIAGSRVTPTRVPASCVSLPVRDASPRAVQQLYATNDLDNTIWLSGSVPSELLEDVSLVPGPGSGATFPLTINTIEFGFNIVNPATTDFDAIVEFYDSIDGAAPAGSPVYIEPAQAGVVVGFAAVPGPGAFTTGSIDVSGLGLTLADAGLFVRIRLVEAGTETRLLGADINLIFEQTVDQTTFAAATVGTTDSQFYRDVDNDGILEAAEGRVFAYPNRLGMYFILEGEAASGGGLCPADFNGDNFLDFFDYDEFVQAFENGC